MQKLRRVLFCLACVATALPVLANSAEETIAIRRIDWVLLNARVDLLADFLEGRFWRAIQPPLLTYQPVNNRIYATSMLDPRANASDPAAKAALADAAKIFCQQAHLPDSAFAAADPLPDIPCVATFYQIRKGHSVEVGEFRIPPPRG